MEYFLISEFLGFVSVSEISFHAWKVDKSFTISFELRVFGNAVIPSLRIMAMLTAEIIDV